MTVIAPGEGISIADTQTWAAGVRGTAIYFTSESVAPWDVPGGSSPAKRPRRQADRDADEVLTLADDHYATRALGVSRGARAVLGVLAEEPDRFERVALMLPPGGHAVGRYATWLASLSGNGPGRPATSVDILVVGQRGDQGHPAGVARDWADRLGARLELFPSGGPNTAHSERFRSMVTEFLNPA